MERFVGDLVVKDNAFVEASYNLDLVANRLFLLAVVVARSQSDDIQQVLQRTIKVSAGEYIKRFGVKKSAAYTNLKKAVNDLFCAEFRYSMLDKNGDLVEYKSRFVQKIGYSKSAGYVEVVFANEVVPLIIGLQKNFTQYEIQQISGLQSKYSVRLYELVIGKVRLGKILKISLNDLRNSLGVLLDEYSRMYDFKKYVLDLSVDEINKNTNIVLSYEQEKEGRTIVGFVFSFKFKEGAEVVNIEFNEVKNDESILAIPYNADDECFADCVVKLLKKEKKAYKEQYSDEQIRAIIARANEYADELTEKGKRVAYGAIYRKAFEEDWGKEFMFKKQKEFEKEQKLLAKKAKEEKEKEEQKRIADNIENDIAKLQEYAEEFVLANQKMVGASGIERWYFGKGEYQGIVKCWKDYLLDRKMRKSFAMLDEILSR